MKVTFTIETDGYAQAEEIAKLLIKLGEPPELSGKKDVKPTQEQIDRVSKTVGEMAQKKDTSVEDFNKANAEKRAAKAAAKKAEEEAAAAAQEEEAQEAVEAEELPPATRAEIKELGGKLMEAGKSTAVNDIIHQFAKSLSSVPDDKLAVLYAKLKELE